MKYAFIAAERGRFPVKYMCELTGVSRAGYYAWRKRRNMLDHRLRANETELRKAIRAAANRGHGRYGRPRIMVQLRRKGFGVGTGRLRRMMQEEGIRGKGGPSRRRKPIEETAAPPSPNLLARNFVADRRDEVWTSDITQHPTTAGWLYSAVVLDLWAHKVVAVVSMSACGAELVAAVLKRALRRHRPSPGLIFHSDQGGQYRSSRVRDLLTFHGIVQSMSRRANCLDNAPSESFFATLKRELEVEPLRSPTETARLILEYCEGFYNRRRLHSSLDYMTPHDFEKANHA